MRSVVDYASHIKTQTERLDYEYPRRFYRVGVDRG